MENKSLETEHGKVICVANVQQMSQKINPYRYQCSFWKYYLHLPTKSMIKPPGQGLWKKTASPSSLSLYKMETKTLSSSIRKASICILELLMSFPQDLDHLFGERSCDLAILQTSLQKRPVHKWHTMILSGSVTGSPLKIGHPKRWVVFHPWGVTPSFDRNFGRHLPGRPNELKRSQSSLRLCATFGIFSFSWGGLLVNFSHVATFLVNPCKQQLCCKFPFLAEPSLWYKMQINHVWSIQREHNWHQWTHCQDVWKLWHTQNHRFQNSYNNSWIL